MTQRKLLVAALGVALIACSSPTDNTDSSEIPVAIAQPVIAAATSGPVTIGTTVTIKDDGWSKSLGGTINVESDATVIYAFVFGGTGGKAPITGVSVGGQGLTKVKASTGPNGLSLDIYRLTSPATGSKAIAATRSVTGYDPVRVTVITVRGASASDPNGIISTVDVTPSTATATKTVNISSATDELTISAVFAAGTYLNGTGVTATSGFQSVVATGEDSDGGWGVVGSRAGAASVTHSWTLKADAAGRYAYITSFTIHGGSGDGTSTPPPADTTTPPPATPPPAAVAGTATFGTLATYSDNGWLSSFGGTMQIESDATVIYAVVFNGTGGKAPVTGASVGGRAMTKIKAAQRTTNASLDVYRLIAPNTGAQQVAITRSVLNYDPVRVSVFTVRGANTTTPNEAITELDITPASANATRTATLYSSTDGLTITAVAASNTYNNGTGISATPGFQVQRMTGEDTDGLWGALGSAPGARPVTHSWDLKADAAGRSAYMITMLVNGATGSPAPPPAAPVQVLPPGQDGFTTILDYDVSQLPPLVPATYLGWSATERSWEKLFYSNLQLVQDATQPGTGSAGAVRVQFLSSLAGGYAPANFEWMGPWPANTGSIDFTFTIKLSSNWDNNGPNNTNDGTKIFFFANQPQNNHFVAIGSRRYDGAEAGGTGTLGGAWLTIGLQNPTVSYKTNVDLTRNVWHTVRIQIVANTPGVANGQLRIWVDGTRALINTGKNDPPTYTERTNVMYYSAGQVAKQNRLEFEPTYGGGTESPPYTQWFDIGHVTAGVK